MNCDHKAKAEEHRRKAEAAKPAKRVERLEQATLYRHVSAIPNLAGKSQLFRPVMKGRRPEAVEWTDVPVINCPGVAVEYKGKALDQADLTGWLITIRMAKERGGFIAAFSGYEFLKAMRKQDNARSYEWLHGWYERITETFIRVITTGTDDDGRKREYSFKGHLAVESIVEGAGKSFALNLSKSLAGMFAVDDWSHINLEQRLELGQNQWAQAFQAFLVCNKPPMWTTRKQLCSVWGAGYAEERYFWRDFQKRVLKPLYEMGFIRKVNVLRDGRVELAW